jgi:cytochrome c-type biogenesis protein CcmH/NrfG
MTLTLVGWILIVASIAISALLFFPLPSRVSRKLGILNKAEADAARTVLPSGLRSSSSWSGQDLRGTSGTLIAPAAVFLLIAGIGTATSYVVMPTAATGSGEAISDLQAQSGADGEVLALADYARSIGAEEPASKAAESKMLPDVSTMIERLAARLETKPDDVQGWRTLGWSYFNTGRYEKAAAAYAKAAELDPASAEIKASYEEARAKATESASTESGATSHADGASEGGGGQGAEKLAKSDAAPPHANDAAIRAMVDGLAGRLESSPRDVEGWIRLMRSRVVLGEKEVAATTFHKALDVFKDDSTASGEITAVATELGLKTE